MQRGMRGSSAGGLGIVVASPAYYLRAVNNSRVISSREQHVARGTRSGYLETHPRRRYPDGALSRKARAGETDIRANVRSRRGARRRFGLERRNFAALCAGPVSFAVAPSGPGTIYRGPELNGPRTKHYYTFPKKSATVRHYNREGWS